MGGDSGFGSCVKLPWWTKHWSARPIADIRDAKLFYDGTIDLVSSGKVAFAGEEPQKASEMIVQKINGHIERKPNSLEFKPNNDGRGWVQLVIDNDKLAESLFSDGVVATVLDLIKRQLQHQLKPYRFVS